MQVDFYQLGGEAVEQVLPQLAARSLGAGERLLVVAEEPALRQRLSRGLWEHEGAGRGGPAFLANGEAGGAHDARQPILLSDRLEAANGARFLALADGLWRPAALGAASSGMALGAASSDAALIPDVAEPFTRVFLLFDEATLAGARQCWVALGGREGLTRRFWRREGRGWQLVQSDG